MFFPLCCCSNSVSHRPYLKSRLVFTHKSPSTWGGGQEQMQGCKVSVVYIFHIMVPKFLWFRLQHFQLCSLFMLTSTPAHFLLDLEMRERAGGLGHPAQTFNRVPPFLSPHSALLSLCQHPVPHSWSPCSQPAVAQSGCHSGSSPRPLTPFVSRWSTRSFSQALSSGAIIRLLPQLNSVTSSTSG